MCLGSEKPVGEGGSKLEVREPGNDNSCDLCSSGPQGSSVGGPRAALGRRGRLLDGGDVCAELTDEQTLTGHAASHAAGCRETKQRGLQGERHTVHRPVSGMAGAEVKKRAQGDRCRGAGS